MKPLNGLPKFYFTYIYITLFYFILFQVSFSSEPATSSTHTIKQTKNKKKKDQKIIMTLPYLPSL